MRHIIIIPARNEAANILRTLSSLLNQTEPADRIYVVNDGSTDETGRIVDEFSQRHPSVIQLYGSDRGNRQMGGGVVRAFDVAYEKCRDEDFDYISKIDADLVFPPDYFENLLRFMDQNPDFGAYGGIPVEHIGDKTLPWRMPASHVPGPLKTIRKRVFDEIGGFIPTLGWDIIDLVKIRSLGYKTGHSKRLEVVHLRQHGTAEGSLRGRAQWGEGAYAIGSHPLFVLGRGLYRMLEPPYLVGGLAFWCGYLKAALTGKRQISDRGLIAALRREQLERLIHFNKLT